MSDFENGGVHPLPENPNSRYFVPPEMWSPSYPSLVCIQCQERSLTQPVLPSAPYLVTTDLEENFHPISAYDRRPMSSEIRGDVKSVVSSGHKSMDNFDAHNADVTSAVTHGAKVNEPMIVFLGIENGSKKSTRISFMDDCWIKGSVLVLFAIAGVMFLSVLACRP